MNFFKTKKILLLLVIIIILLTLIISTNGTNYIKKTAVVNKKAMDTSTSLLASTQSIANYDDVEDSIKEAINKELNAEVDKKSEEAINEKVLSAYPIGSIYISTSSTNPSEFIGGTWEAYGQGRTLVGTGINGGNTFTAGKTGGEYEHTITTDELPSHIHSISSKGSISSTFTGSAVTTDTESAHTHTITATVANAGSHTHAFDHGGQAIVIDGNSGPMEYANGFTGASGQERMVD